MTPDRIEQRVFDACVLHLLTQRQRSILPGTGFCGYRGGCGLRCALGALIPDELYDPRMERASINYTGYRESQVAGSALARAAIRQMLGIESLAGHYIDSAWARGKGPPITAGGYHASLLGLLRVLQDVHDRVDPHRWKARLTLVAEEFGLEWRFQDAPNG